MKLFPKIKTGNERYPALTGIRALGATAVFFDHFPFSPDFHIRINVLAFFFVLSGFLITRLYYDKAEITGSNMRKYFTNRFARIYPVYFLLLSIALCIKHDFRPWLLIKNYTLTHALVNNYNDFVIGQSWSLTVEECFYFLAPFIILLTRRINFMAALAFGCTLLAGALLIAQPWIPLFKTPLFVFSATFFGHFAEFYAGIYLALVIMKKEKHGPIQLKGLKFTIAGTLGVLLLIIAMGYIYAYPPTNDAGVIFINNFLIPVPIAILYYGLMCEKSVVSRLLSTRPLAILGKSSYTFYLLHVLVIYNIGIPFILPYFGNHYLVSAVVTYLLAYYVSIIIYMFYEEPLNIFIRRKLVKHTPSATPEHARPC